MQPAPTPADADAERRQRQAALVQELQTLAMDLARLAHRKAAEHLAQPDPEPGDDVQAQTPSTRQHHSILSFTRLSRLVGALCDWENRIAAGQRPQRKPWRPLPTPDERRDPVKRALHQALADAPDRAARRRDADHLVEQAIEDDPDGHVPAMNLLMHVANALDLHVDLAHLDDAMLATFVDPNPHEGSG